MENDQASIEFEDGGSYRFVLEVLLCPKQEFPYVSDEIKAKVLFPLKSLEVATLDATSLPPAGAGAKYFLRRVSKYPPMTREELLAFQRISHMAASYDDSGSKDFVSSEMSQREQWWPLTFRPSLDVRTRDAPGTTFGHSEAELFFIGLMMRLVARDEAFVKQLSCEGEEDLSPEGGP